MNTALIRLMLLTIALATFGCTYTTHMMYQDSTTATPLGNGQYRITFERDNTSKDDGTAFAYLRASETTILDGYSYFTVDRLEDQTTEGTYIIPAMSTSYTESSTIYSGIFSKKPVGVGSTGTTVHTSEQNVSYDQTRIVALISAYNTNPPLRGKDIYDPYFLYTDISRSYNMGLEASLQVPYKGWIGIQTKNLTKVQLLALGIENKYPASVIVSEVEEGGPAYLKGINKNDIIIATIPSTGVNGTFEVPIRGSSDLAQIVSATKPNRRLPLVVLKQGKIRTVNVYPTSSPRPLDAPTYGWIGISTVNPDQGLLDLIGFSEDTHTPALILSAVRGLPAYRHGVRDGDIVLEANQRQVNGSSDLRTIIQKTTPGETISLKILRDGITRTINIKAALRPFNSENK